MAGLVIPAINTFWLSLTNTAATGQKFQIVNGKLVPLTAKFVGGSNYAYAFTDPYTRGTLIRTVLWIVIVPLMTVGVGLLVALLMDRMKYTSFFKTMIFMPNAISFVGASLIWDADLQRAGLPAERPARQPDRTALPDRDVAGLEAPASLDSDPAGQHVPAHGDLDLD